MAGHPCGHLIVNGGAGSVVLGIEETQSVRQHAANVVRVIDYQHGKPLTGGPDGCSQTTWGSAYYDHIELPAYQRSRVDYLFCFHRQTESKGKDK